MKKLITVLLTVVSVTSFLIDVKAETETEQNWVDKNKRSVSFYINIEGNDLYIHSNKQYDQVNILVVDANGMTIYADVINIPAEESLVIPLSDLSEGNYQVILSKNNQPVVWYVTK